MLHAGHAIQAMLVSARSLYDQLIPATLNDCDWTPGGLMFVFRTPQGMDHYAQTDRLLRDEFDLRRPCATRAARSRRSSRRYCPVAPALVLSNRRPPAARQADVRLVPALAALDVEVRDACALLDLEVEGRIARRLVTSQGRLRPTRWSWPPVPGRRSSEGCCARESRIQPGKAIR